MKLPKSHFASTRFGALYNGINKKEGSFYRMFVLCKARKLLPILFLPLFMVVVLIATTNLSKASAEEVYYYGVNTGLYGDDRTTGAINMGFNFTFYGNTYSDAYITTNGLLMFGSGSTAYSNSSIPNSSLPNNYIAPFWDDLIVQSGKQTIYYKTIGETPNRQFIVQWTNMYFYYNQSLQMGTFQAIIDEGTNEIQIQYRALLGGDSSRGNSATIGLENSDGTAGQQFSYNTASISEGDAIRFAPSGGSYTVNSSATYNSLYLVDELLPSVPVLTSPSDGGESVNVPVNLTWNSSNLATSYRVLVSTNIGFSNIIVNQSGIVTTSYNVSGLNYNSQYYWRVEALNSSGSTLSSTNTFTTGPRYSTISNLPVNTDVRLVNNTSVDVSSTPQTGVNNVRIYSSGVPVVDVPIDFAAGDPDWSSVTVASSIETSSSVVHLAGNTYDSGTHTIYVPKGDTKWVRICPSALTLEDVTPTCVGGKTFMDPFPRVQVVGSDTVSVSIVRIDGSFYYKAEGLTGTGGIGINGEYFSDGSWYRTGTLDTINFETLIPLIGGDKIVLTWNNGLDDVAASVSDAEINNNPSTAIVSQIDNNITLIIPAGGLDAGSHTITGTFLQTYDPYTYNAAHSVAINTLRSDNETVGYGLAIIYDDNTVDVSASVPPFINMTLDKTNLDLGVLSVSSIKHNTNTLTIYTNIGVGYALFIESDGNLRSGLNNIKSIDVGENVEAGVSSYGVSIAPYAGTSKVGDFLNDEAPISLSRTKFINSNSESTGHSHVVTYKASISSSTVAGNYAQLVTYTVASNL